MNEIDSYASARSDIPKACELTAMDSYVLLKEPIPAHQASRLLGRIVKDPLRPLHAYCPEDPRLNELLDVVEATTLDVQTSVELSSDTDFKTKLFRLSSSRGSSSIKWEAQRMVTRSLTQHQIAFDTVYSLHKADLNRLITSWRGIGYMAVSTKALIDGEISTQQSRGSSVSASIDFSISDAISVNLGRSSSSGSRAIQGTFTKIVDEQVFAVCYRTVKVRTTWLSRASELKLGSGIPASQFSGGGSSRQSGGRDEQPDLGPERLRSFSSTAVDEDRPEQEPLDTDTSTGSPSGEGNENTTSLITNRAQPVLQTLAAAPDGAVKIVEALDTDPEFWRYILDLKAMNSEVLELDDTTGSDLAGHQDEDRSGKPAHAVLVTEEKLNELADNIVVFETSASSAEGWERASQDLLQNWFYRFLWVPILFPALEALEILETPQAAGTDRIRWRCVRMPFHLCLRQQLIHGVDLWPEILLRSERSFGDRFRRSPEDIAPRETSRSDYKVYR